MKQRSKKRGAAMVEFALAGIASATLLISTVQLSLSMWNYHTLAYATHETNRYISVHGRSCTQGGNSCAINVGNIATKFKTLAVGLPADSVTMTLTSHSGTAYTCNPLSSCLTDNTQWPPVAHYDNAPGHFSTVQTSYSRGSALVMIWPGSSPSRIGRVTLPSQSKIVMQF
jgi:Flp pilus assembly protein TadG